MSLSNDKYKDLDWVLTALQVMIDETIYHMKTFAHTLDVHHNTEVADIFAHAYEQFKKEEALLVSYVGEKSLPTIAPWDTLYPDYQHPSEVLGGTDYLMTVEEAWKAIEQISQIHKDFYHFLLNKNEKGELVNFIESLLEHCKTCEVTHQNEASTLHPNDKERHDDLDLVHQDNFKGMFQ